MRRTLLAATAFAFGIGAAVVTMPAQSADSVQTYTVRPGDTWWRIVRAHCGGRADAASAYRFSVAATNLANGIVNPGYIIHVDTANCPTENVTTTTVTLPPTTTIPPTTTAPTTTLPPTTTTVPTSNVDIAAWLQPRQIAAPFTSDEGAFRLICMPSHLAWDDPIVAPGQSFWHLHQFWGNTLAGRNSTYESLRSSGNGTCQSGPINRSAYWNPVMLDGQGRVVNPDYAVVYYKGDPNTANLPAGLRYIAGDAMGAIPDSQLYGSANAGIPGGYEFHPYWYCLSTGTQTVGIPTNCPVGTSNLGAVISFPYCWNGQTDSANHRSHVVFPKRGANGLACPTSHPVQLPHFTFQIWWTVQAGDDLSTWRLSSDTMPDGTQHPAGTTIHADWFGAWEPSISDVWAQECIREMRSGVAADFCNGTGGRQPSPWYWVNPTHYSAVPPKA